MQLLRSWSIRLKSEIEKAANKGYATGALKNSIKATKATVNKQGCFAAVRPTGVDEKGVRNGEKFGIPGKWNQ